MQRKTINYNNSNFDWVRQEVKDRTRVITRHKKNHKKTVGEYIKSLLF